MQVAHDGFSSPLESSQWEDDRRIKNTYHFTLRALQGLSKNRVKDGLTLQNIVLTSSHCGIASSPLYHPQQLSSVEAS